MRLEEVSVGTILDYGAYGPMKVESASTALGGWNGKVRITTIRFTTGLGFTALASSEARHTCDAWCTHPRTKGESK